VKEKSSAEPVKIRGEGGCHPLLQSVVRESVGGASHLG